jgi:hypothetical protein
MEVSGKIRDPAALLTRGRGLARPRGKPKHREEEKNYSTLPITD